jgi:hypothetical protein
MIWAVGAPLALPMPRFMPTWVGIVASKAFTFIGGVVVGSWLLGYKVSYEEYYRKEDDPV